MANVLNRTTLEERYSVNTPNYPIDTWIINPDLSGVVGVPKKYWKIVGDTISEMNQSEKDAVDATLLPGIKTTRKAQLQSDAEYLIESQGYSKGMQSSLNASFAKNKGAKVNKAKSLDNWAVWVELVNLNVKQKQDLVDDQTSIDAVDSITLDDNTLRLADPKVSLGTVLELSDSTDLDTFMDANALVIDPYTNVEGPFYLMQTLENRREIFNDSSNPLYMADKTAILGPTGYLVDHANRILNLELIHGKLGWHNQEIVKAGYSRPKDLLFYYGYPNSFNSYANGWNNENVAQDMAKYNLIVLGDGVEDPSHPDYANTQTIIPRVQELHCSTKIFGYVSVNQSFGDFTGKVNEWGALGTDGIFMDEAGYDFGDTRAEFNQKVDYIHDRTSTNICFVNSWNTDHVLGTANDPSYPNSTYNDSSAESHLTENDWILLESWPINTLSYTASNPDGYESASDWYYRGEKMLNLRATYGVNFASVGMINNDNADNTALFEFSFISAMMYSMEAHGTSDTNYGASSARVNYYPRPDVSLMGVVYNLNCNIQQDGADSNIYHRYVENAKMSLNFTDTAQSSVIDKF